MPAVVGAPLYRVVTRALIVIANMGADPSQTTQKSLQAMALFLILVALLFKVAAVQFHMWLPDAYQGAPPPITGFMAAGIKAAAFGGMLRLLTSVFAQPNVALGHAGWARILGLVAFASMTLGDLAAIRQEYIKRMLAYSSISHAGYLLIGVTAAGFGVPGAKSTVIFYLVAYVGTPPGAFTVASWAGRKGDECQDVDDWAGLARRRPAIALVMTLFMLSLGGFPPTGGFFAKFYLFRAAALRPELVWLVVAAVLNHERE